MTDPNAEVKEAPAEQETPKKRPYVAPRLVELGKVRDLTAAGGASSTDGGFTRRP